MALPRREVRDSEYSVVGSFFTSTFDIRHFPHKPVGLRRPRDTRIASMLGFRLLAPLHGSDTRDTEYEGLSFCCSCRVPLCDYFSDVNNGTGNLRQVAGYGAGPEGKLADV